LRSGEVIFTLKKRCRLCSWLLSPIIYEQAAENAEIDQENNAELKADQRGVLVLFAASGRQAFQDEDQGAEQRFGAE